MAGKRDARMESKKRARVRLLVLIFAIILAAALLIAGVRLYRETEANRAVIESLSEEVLDETARAESIRSRLSEGETESFVKEEARRLGLAESDDTIYRLEPQQ